MKIEGLELAHFIGKSLKDFQLVEMKEVYEADADGRRTFSFGFFMEYESAVAFVRCKPGSLYRVEKSIILTNGMVGFEVEERSIKLFTEKKVLPLK